MSFWVRLAFSVMSTLGGLGAIQFSVSVEFGNIPVQPPVAVDQLGWSQDFNREQYEQIPALEIFGDSAENHVHDNIRLWEMVRAVNHGQDSINIKQEIGDCVSHATDKAVEHLNSAQIYLSGLDRPFIDFCPHWFYGISRVLIGKGQLGNGDGSVVSWACEGIKKYGCLPADLPGVPDYSGRVAKSWGINGPPAELMHYAKQYMIKGVRRCANANDCVMALANGYPLITGSQYGTKQLIVQDNRRVGPHDGQWGHSMPIVGYDGSSPSGRRYFSFFNSWGEDAHGTPLQGEPKGSFWITWEVMDWICKTGQVYAISDMESFPRRKLDFDVLGAVVQRPAVLQEDFYMSAFTVGLALLVVSVIVWMPSRTGIMSLMLAVMFIPNAGMCADKFDALDLREINYQALEITDSPVTQVPTVIVYSIVPCPPCDALKQKIKDGDAQLKVVYKDRSEMPPELQAVADKQGYPFAHCDANKKFISHAPRSLDDLKYLANQPIAVRHVRR